VQGATNEEVPSNDEFYLLPLWERLVIRTAYVAFVCILAIIMPFFGGEQAGEKGALGGK